MDYARSGKRADEDGEFRRVTHEKGETFCGRTDDVSSYIYRKSTGGLKNLIIRLF